MSKRCCAESSVVRILAILTLLSWAGTPGAADDIFVDGARVETNADTPCYPVALAALVMTVVYLIPHSMRGSELNYEAVDAGVSASEAVGTSKD